MKPFQLCIINPPERTVPSWGRSPHRGVDAGPFVDGQFSGSDDGQAPAVNRRGVPGRGDRSTVRSTFRVFATGNDTMRDGYWLPSLLARRTNHRKHDPTFHAQRLGSASSNSSKSGTCSSIAPAADYCQVAPAWFAAAAEIAPRLSAGAGRSLATSPESDSAASQWIVRLTSDAVDRIDSVAGTASLLDGGTAGVEVVRGLGLPGLVLVEADGDPGGRGRGVGDQSERRLLRAQLPAHRAAPAQRPPIRPAVGPGQDRCARRRGTSPRAARRSSWR